MNVLLDELLKPYTHENRPWMDCECLDGMNKRYEDVMAHLPEVIVPPARHSRDALWENSG